ncbi:unnamed protein product [Gongylonema pulchrum]|uniref:Pept_C1 domain-containing protein n=1 Tax=Gongylonema pulchrum TaxID=637853 RepID=A0A183E5Q3_9BILA|nr:unnamed protein product [Gongylonema pulchrum]
MTSCEDPEESVPIAQEAKEGAPLDVHDATPYIASRKKSKKNKCGIRKRRNLTVPVIVITGIGVLLLATIIVCIVIETVSPKTGTRFWGTKVWRNHDEQDSVYHLSIVAYVNQLNTTWKAKYNRFASRSLGTELTPQEMSELVEEGKKMNQEQLLGDTIEHMKILRSRKVRLPQQFDARLRWPLCWSVHQVSNQGGCGSCWILRSRKVRLPQQFDARLRWPLCWSVHQAMSAASVMSDRLCIATNYTNQKQISAQDLVSCCTECGGNGLGDLCCLGEARTQMGIFSKKENGKVQAIRHFEVSDGPEYL